MTAARAYPRSKVSVRQFGGGWHVHCGECGAFACSNCLSYGNAMTHHEALVFAYSHIEDKHETDRPGHPDRSR